MGKIPRVVVLQIDQLLHFHFCLDTEHKPPFSTPLNIISYIGEPTDFLTVEPDPVYDRVVMNPPFGRQADIKHVSHALKFLKPGGLLVSVMASSVTFRSNKLTTDFRQLIEERGGHIEELPEGAFKSSGTMVNTVIVVIPG